MGMRSDFLFIFPLILAIWMEQSLSCDPSFCVTRTHGQHYCDPADNTSYYICDWGETKHFSCLGNLVYDGTVCNWPNNGACVPNPQPETNSGYKDGDVCQAFSTISAASTTSEPDSTTATTTPPDSTTSESDSTTATTTPPDPTASESDSSTATTTPLDPTTSESDSTTATTTPTPSTTSAELSTTTTSTTAATTETIATTETSPGISSTTTPATTPRSYLFNRHEQQKSACSTTETSTVSVKGACAVRCVGKVDCNGFNFALESSTCYLLSCATDLQMTLSSNYDFFEQI